MESLWGTWVRGHWVTFAALARSSRHFDALCPATVPEWSSRNGAPHKPAHRQHQLHQCTHRMEIPKCANCGNQQNPQICRATSANQSCMQVPSKHRSTESHSVTRLPSFPHQFQASIPDSQLLGCRKYTHMLSVTSTGLRFHRSLWSLVKILT